MKFDNTPDAAPPAEPTAGGSWRREADGALTLTQQTQPAQGRAKRAPAQPVDAVAVASTDHSQE
jgi:hypothetical protein